MYAKIHHHHHHRAHSAYAKICPHPAAGTLEMAAKPFGTSANFKPAEGER